MQVEQLSLNWIINYVPAAQVRLALGEDSCPRPATRPIEAAGTQRLLPEFSRSCRPERISRLRWRPGRPWETAAERAPGTRLDPALSGRTSTEMEGIEF